jgi:hypothetical protein
MAKNFASLSRGIGGNAALTLDDLIDAPGRHADPLGEAVLANFQPLEEVLREHHPGVHGIEFALGHMVLLQW